MLRGNRFGEHRLFDGEEGTDGRTRGAEHAGGSGQRQENRGSRQAEAHATQHHQEPDTGQHGPAPEPSGNRGERSEAIDLLTTISGFSELVLRDGPTNEEWVERVRYINDAARSLTQLLFRQASPTD